MKLMLYSLKFLSLPSSNNLMFFLPWDIVNIRKLNRNVVTSPSPICPCCMLNEKENSLSNIVIRTKRPCFIAFILTQWFSSLFILQVILNGVHKLTSHTTHNTMPSLHHLHYLLIKHIDMRLTKYICRLKENF